MGKILSSEQLEVGMHITVVQGQELNTDFFNPFRLNLDNGEPAADTKKKQYDRSYMGDVLTVLAIDNPFIVARRETGNFYDKKEKITLDLRVVGVMELSKAFIQEMCPELIKKEEQKEIPNVP